MEIEIISSVIVIICTKQDCLLLPKFFGCLPSGHSDGTIFSLVECYVESKGKRNVAELYILLFCFFPPVQCHLWTGIPAKSGAVHHWDLWRVSGGCQCLQHSS